jgi:predicted HicB family RNase H-like nuclease
MTTCYQDVVTKKVTTVRMPEEFADTVEVVARGRDISVNALVIEALLAEVERSSRTNISWRLCAK